MTEMDKAARGWMISTAKANYWRVESNYDFDDLVQDGFLCWQFVVEHYERKPGRIRRRPHLMALFKRAYTNYIHGLAKRRTKRADEIHLATLAPRVAVEGPDDMLWDQYVGALAELNHGQLVAEAPPLLAALLHKLDAGRCAALRSLYRVFDDGSRETLNDRLCRIVGADPQANDLATQLKAYLHAA